MMLKGKRLMVTGASQGFGLAAAKAFLREGARVAVCSRTQEDLDSAVGELSALSGDSGSVLGRVCDVTSPAQLEAFAADTFRVFAGLDGVLCNAGVYGPKGPSDEVDWQAWSQAIDINLKGVVLTCRAVLPVLKAAARGKILIMSGGGATSPMPFLSAYAASKAGVVRFAESLALEVRDHGIQVNCIAPGALNTRMLDEVLEAGPELVGQGFYDKMLDIKTKGGTPLETGVDLCVHLASDQSGPLTGKLLSAVWDPWREFTDHAQDLNGTDIFTLRRIIPRDRGKDWG
jgi:NAD(P)-dependent dehydrogenase (short-subunit alcohol dehydrogenase family)